MSEWKKYTVESKYLLITGTIAFFIFLISIYIQSWLAFLVSVFVLLLQYFNRIYLKKVGEGLSINHRKVRGKFFPGEEGNWVLDFHNNGVPLMKARLIVFYNDAVKPLDGSATKRSSAYKQTIPFTINHRQKKTITIPFTAEKRGISRIQKIEMQIPHFFGLGETILENESFSNQEALVYPNTIEVKNKHVLLTNKQGETFANHSLFEDYLSPAGTRDYHFSDSFNRIHWKASARKQTLQTKIYDKVTEVGWNISVNIGDDHFISKNLEELLSGTADLAYFFVKQNIPFSLCINIRNAGGTPFVYIMPGTGKEHLQRVLETIALVNLEASVYPYHKMLAYYIRHLNVQPFFLHAGQNIHEKGDALRLLADKGTSVYELLVEEQIVTIVKKSFLHNRGISS
jgi:uncharacterized protein (DUF58 family)